MLLNINPLFFGEVLFLLMRFTLMGPKITLKDISFLLFKGFFPVHLGWISKIRGNISIARAFIIKLCSLHNGDMAKFKWKVITVFPALASAALPPFLLPLPFSPSKPHNHLCLTYERLAQHRSFPQVRIFLCRLGEKSCSIFNYTQTSLKERAYILKRKQVLPEG